MLQAAGRAPETERSSRAAPLSRAEVQAILSSVEQVIIYRGRRTLEMTAGDAGPDDLKGPTGTFRAPLVHVDNTLLVGFNRQALADFLA